MLCTRNAKSIVSLWSFLLWSAAKVSKGSFSHSTRRETTGQVDSRPWHGSCEACVDIKSYKAMLTSTHISTEGLGVQAMCNGDWSPWKQLWRRQCVKLWRWSKSCNGEARNMECLPKKAADNEWRCSKTEDIWGANSKPIGVGLAKPISAHGMTPLHPATGHVSTGLCVCLPVFQSWGDTILLCYCPVPSSWSWDICCVPLMCFQGFTAKSLEGDWS